MAKIPSPGRIQFGSQDECDSLVFRFELVIGPPKAEKLSQYSRFPRWSADGPRIALHEFQGQGTFTAIGGRYASRAVWGWMFTSSSTWMDLMKCCDARERLSAYHDRELSSDVDIQVYRHVRDCCVCAAELHGFGRLTKLARRLPVWRPPRYLWSRVQRDLESTGEARRPFGNYVWSLRRIMPMVAAVLVVVIGSIAFSLYRGSRFGQADHDVHLVANFARFAGQFASDSEAAQQRLCCEYRGKRVDSSRSERLVGYRPLAVRRVPPGYSLESVHVLTMPCCTCWETIYRRDSGGPLAIFEHEDDSLDWFGDRPRMAAKCHGVTADIVQFDDQLAFTWKQGRRRITVVGVLDVSEITQLIGYFSGAS